MQNKINNDILFEGEVGLYRQVELSTWGETSFLIPFDSDLKSLGFTFVGDLLSSALAQGVLRGYVHPKEHTRALLLVGVKDSKLNIFGLFFDSLFINGASVTTTTSPALKDKSANGVYRRVYAWNGIFDLYQKHQAYLCELKKLNGDLQPFDETLLSMAKSLDSVSARSG